MTAPAGGDAHMLGSVTDTRDQVAALRWYHTMDLPGEVTTPGEYDLRPIVDRLPWPDLAGARCIDIGSRDGFYAFEMERRGAREVVSIDLDDPSQVHFPGSVRPPDSLISKELDDGHRAFGVAHQALGSAVRREFVSIYDLADAGLGEFDLAVIGTLLLHLRDPVRALRAVRDVVGGNLLLNEPIIPGVDSLRRRPVAHPYMESLPFWWVCNAAGLRRMAEAAGFEVVEAGRPYLVPNGPTGINEPARAALQRPRGQRLTRLISQRGAPHAWLLLRPARSASAAAK